MRLRTMHKRRQRQLARERRLLQSVLELPPVLVKISCYATEAKEALDRISDTISKMGPGLILTQRRFTLGDPVHADSGWIEDWPEEIE